MLTVPNQQSTKRFLPLSYTIMIVTWLISAWIKVRANLETTFHFSLYFNWRSYWEIRALYKRCHIYLPRLTNFLHNILYIQLIFGSPIMSYQYNISTLSLILISISVIAVLWVAFVISIFQLLFRDVLRCRSCAVTRCFSTSSNRFSRYNQAIALQNKLQTKDKAISEQWVSESLTIIRSRLL